MGRLLVGAALVSCRGWLLMAAWGSYSPGGPRLEGRATGRRWLLPRDSTSWDSLVGYIEAAIQNCLARLASCAEVPVNTSNPWGQISTDSLWLGSLPPAPVSMAAQDASLRCLTLPPAPPCGEPSSWPPPPPAALRFPGERLGSSACLWAIWSPLLRYHRLRDRSKPWRRDRKSQTSGLGWFLSCWESGSVLELSHHLSQPSTHRPSQLPSPQMYLYI